MKSMKMTMEVKDLFGPKRRFPWSVLIVIAVVLLFLFSINLFFTNNILVETEVFSMPTLQKSMEGYSILHLSDIRERNLGENGATLKEKIDGQKTNICVITGGLVGADGSAEGFLQALACLQEAKIPTYYIIGAQDPPFTDYLKDGSYGIHPVHAQAQALGAMCLNIPVRLSEGDTALWLFPNSSLTIDPGSAIDSLNALEKKYLENPDEVAKSGHSLDALLQNIAYKRENAQAYQQAVEQRTANDLNIILSHRPALPETMQSALNTQLFSEADLILSGYNCGPQYCLPMNLPLKASNDQLPRDGWFPAKEYVRGMSNASGQWQYISPGLGTGGKTFLGTIRSFNSPTITIIQLTRKIS